jgi:hypothetical protein
MILHQSLVAEVCPNKENKVLTQTTAHTLSAQKAVPFW